MSKGKDEFQPKLDDEQSQRLVNALMLKDSKLPRSIQYIGGEKPRQEAKNILVIGSTGVIGPYLLYEILQNSDAKITCLARDLGDDDPKHRIFNALASYDLLDKIDQSRIEVIAGNIAHPNFDLDQDVYQTLAKTIDIVFLNAAWANHLRPYAWPHTCDKSDLRETNILSLKQTLKFAASEKTKYVNFTSSVATVNRCDLSGNLVEELPGLNNPGDHIYLGYPQSKFIAEQLIQQALARQIPCRVYRLGVVTGDSQTGVQHAENDHMMLEIKACTQMGSAPDWHTGRNFLAVDIAAKIMAAIGLEENIMDGAYNILNPKSISWHDLIGALNQRGYPIKIIPESEWLQQLASVDQDNALFRFKAAYLEVGGIDKGMPSMGHYFKSKINFEKTLEALADHYIKTPSTAALLEKYVDYFQQTGFFANPNNHHS